MNSIDQDPRKRRKLSLSNKTQSRLRGSSRLAAKPHTPKSGHIPIPKKSLRTLRGPCQNVDSSDESSLEIGWDNNSPSPSTCAKQGKRVGKGKKNDIAAILKKVPKKKKVDSKDGQSDGTLNTWMQNDLAVCTYSGDKKVKCSNRKSRHRSQKRGAKTFNEELKSFIEKVVQSGECETVPVGSTPQRRSPQVACQSKASPNLVDISPINRKIYESPVNLPLYESPDTTPICRNAAVTPLCKRPVNSPLVPDNFDNINWSYLDTPAIKKSCQANKNENLSVDNTKTKAFPCKTLYEKDSDDEDVKPTSCKTLYKAENMDTESTTTKPSEIFHNGGIAPCDISLTNIDLDDTMEENKPELSRNVADTVIVDNPLSVNPDAGDVNFGNVKSTPPLRVDSLMNIDFDDDLDDILSSQPLDLKSIEKTDLPKINYKLVTDENRDKCTLVNKELMKIQVKETMSSGGPITERKENNMLSEDPLSEDDNFSDILVHLDNHKTGERFNCDTNTTVGKEKVIDCGSTKTAKVVTMCTPNRKSSQVDLIAFDDADDLFDDIIVSLDGAVKCKSQETPPQSITSDQRKMKSRCHTSPFPLSSKRTLLQNDSKCGKDKSPILGSTDKNCTVNKLHFNESNAIKENNFGESIDSKPNLLKSNGAKSHLPQQPVLPHTKNNNNNNKNNNNNDFSSFKKFENSSIYKNNGNKHPLDMSVIGKIENQMEDDVSVCLPITDATKMDTLTSTQKCSFDEIQRKRELAQLKLKERNRWKK